MNSEFEIATTIFARSAHQYWRAALWPGVLLLLGLGFALIPLANGEMFFYWDNAQQHYPQTAFLHEALKSGAIPHWWPQVGSGIPTVAEGQSAHYHPIRLLLAFLLAPPAALMVEIGIYLAVAGLSTYFFLREFRLRRSACLVGGLCQMFGSFSIVFIRNMALHRSFCLLPLAMLFAERFVTSKKLSYGLATSVLLGLQLLAGHPTFAVVTVVATTLYILCRMFQRSLSLNESLRLAVRKLRNGTIAWTLAVLLGVGVGAIQFFPQLLHVDQSVREGGFNLKFASSLPVQVRYLPQLLFPYAYLQGDWLRQPDVFGRVLNVVPSSGIYIGALPVLLVIFSLWWHRRWHDPVWPLTMCFVVAMGLSLGISTPLYPALWSLPGLGGVRFPHRFLLWSSFVLACIATFGLNRVLAHRRLGGLKKGDIRLFVFVVAGLLLLGLLFWTQEEVIGIYAQISQDFRFGIIMSLALFIVAFALVGGLLTVRRRYQGFVLMGLIVFVFVDLWIFRMRSGYAPTFPINEVLAPPAVVEFLKKDKEQFRVMSLIPDDRGLNRNEDLSEFLQADTSSIWGIDSTDVWLSLFPKRYYALREGVVWELLNSSEAAVKLAPLLGALNVKYIVAARRVTLRGWTKVQATARAAVWKNPVVLPRAFLVGKVVPENVEFREEWFERSVKRLQRYYEMVSHWWSRREDAQIVDAVLSQKIDFQKAAVIAGKEGPEIAGLDPESDVNAGPPRADTMSFVVKSESPALLVISSSYYPGWTAKVNGKVARLFRANYFGMGVFVPSGQSEVVLRFETPGFRWGAVVSAISLCLCTAGLLVPQVRSKSWAPLAQSRA